MGGGIDAIVLAGGRGSRLGGIAKPLLTVGGRRLVDRVADAAAAAGASRIVVSGPVSPAPRPVVGSGDAPGADVEVAVVSEDPPFGGPLAGLAAALTSVDADRVLVLAGDLPFAREAIAALVAAHDREPDRDGAIAVDPGGRTQWLLGLYRRDALVGAVDRVASERGTVRDARVRAALEALDLVTVPAGDGAIDVDRWRDLARAAARTPTLPEGADMTSPRDPLPPEALDDWTAALAARLGLDAAEVPIAAVLDLARDVAHGVARPAAPLSAFLAGLAAGRTGDVDAALRATTELAADWGER